MSLADFRLDSKEKSTVNSAQMYSIVSDDAASIAALCEDAYQDGDGYRARCPAHNGISNTSLSIKQEGARVLLYCHSGCTYEDIRNALGLRPPASMNGHSKKPVGKKKPLGPITHTYDYVDANGVLVHQTTRHAPKAFRQRRPDPSNPGQWIWKLDDITTVLYRLPDLLRAIESDKTIHIVEGEKDVESLERLGLTATTNVMGGGKKKWKESYSQTLQGANVVILPDNDKTGQEHVNDILDMLPAYTDRIKIVSVPAPHKDVSDWLAADGTAEQLKALIDATPAWEPGEAAQGEGLDDALYGAPKPRNPEALPYSDYTNALAFVADHGQDLRYCYDWYKWLVWTGTHWRVDNTGEVMRKAKQTVKQLASRIASMDDYEAKALLKHIKASLATSKLEAMIKSAQSEPGIAVQPSELNTHHWLLNCTNGTIDLKTGMRRKHDRKDLLTHCLNISYNKDATCAEFEKFLHAIMDNNASMVDFLQRAFGYSLTGDVREQKLFILWGKGSNGKSTLVDTFLRLLNCLAMKATPDLLLVSKNDRHPTEKAGLFGKRFVAAVETEDGARLSETIVKELTGGDVITARRMREDFWEFWPTHKVFLATNHKPTIRGTDHAIWRRIKLIPFVVTIADDQQDKGLPEKLTKEMPGILAWAVRGCLAWQKDGLGEPDEVKNATAGYRSDMDVLGRFIDECCQAGIDKKVRASTLYDSYQKWCLGSGEYVQTMRKVGEQLGPPAAMNAKFTVSSMGLLIN